MGDAPTIFYSRQIGLSNGIVIPILGGGRLSGRAGKWSVGALNMASRADTTARVPLTDFTVLRVRRELVQYASSTHSLSTNFRFRWEYQPGSELFVVYTDGHDTAAVLGAPSLQNRGVVIKANRSDPQPLAAFRPRHVTSRSTS